MIADKSEKVSCPFNSAHTIEPRRLQAHIIKCKRNLPPNHNYVQCPYWDLHYVKRDKLQDHKLNCEHRLLKVADKRMWEIAETTVKFSEAKLVVDSVGGDGYVNDQSWDTPAGPSFKIEDLRASSKHMVDPQGLTPSQRRDHKEKERKRLRQLEETRVTMIKKEKIHSQSQVHKELSPTPKKRLSSPKKSASTVATDSVRKEATLVTNAGKGKFGLNNNTAGSGRHQIIRFSDEDFPSL